MKKVLIPKTVQLPKIDPNDSTSIADACAFLLTRLVSDRRPSAIFAKWDPQQGIASWKFSESSDFMFETPEVSRELFRVTELSVFRSMLARLGDFLIKDTYLGAGTCELSFSEESDFHSHLAVVFSNTRETGFWAKLQMLR